MAGRQREAHRGARCRSIVCVVACLLGSPAAADAQGFPAAHPSELIVTEVGDSVVLSGVLRAAESGQPLAQAQLYEVGSRDGTLSDERGWFRLALSKPLTAPLRVERIGHERLELEPAVLDRRADLYVKQFAMAYCDFVFSSQAEPPTDTVPGLVTVRLLDVETGHAVREPARLVVERLDEFESGPRESVVEPADSVALPIVGPGVYRLDVRVEGFEPSRVGPFQIPTKVCVPFEIGRHHQDVWMTPR